MRVRVCAFIALSILPWLASAHDSLPSDAADLPISQLLVLASSSLAAGKSAAALSIYDYCLERDPTDFATLYKRATVRLATGQWTKAKEGFNEVLQVKEFDQAHLALAKLHTKLGEFEDAQRQIGIYLDMQGSGSPSKEIFEAKELQNQIKSAESAIESARKALKAKPYITGTCQSFASIAVQLAPNSAPLRLLRAEGYLLDKDWDSTVGDLSRASFLMPSIPQYLLLRMSLISALFIEHGRDIPPESLQSVKRCLSADPDSKSCRAGFKSLKSIEKELSKLRNWIEGGRWGEAILALSGTTVKEGILDSIRSLIALHQKPVHPSSSEHAPLPMQSDLHMSSPLLTSLMSALCQAHVMLGQIRKSTPACQAVLARDPEDIWALIGKSDQLVAEENWEEAVRILSAAFEKTGRSDREILTRLQKAQRLLKQSTAKDYYKVLGVSRDADAKTIKKAYRKMTLKAHPDKEGGSEQKMAALNEAYEVLSNPELRQRFDNGEDPNDPTVNQQQPFAQGGHPFAQFFQQQAGQQFFQQGQGGYKFNVKFG